MSAKSVPAVPPLTLFVTENVPVVRFRVLRTVAVTPAVVIGSRLAGVSTAEYALGAASWRSRAWLDAPDTLVDGAWADLVVYDADPRLEVAVTKQPRLVVLRGRVVASA